MTKFTLFLLTALAAIVIDVYGINKDNSAVLWLQQKQWHCISIKLSFKQTLDYIYHCIFDKTYQCNNDVADYDEDEIILHHFCGTIKSQNIKQTRQTWKLQFTTDIKIYVQQFSLYHNYYRCEEETMVFRSNDGLETFCGNRLPWKMFFSGPVVIIVFSTKRADSQAKFILHFHRLYTKFYEKFHILLFRYVPEAFQDPLLFHTTLDYIETFYIYSDFKFYVIEVSVNNAINIDVICYDGPGDKSPLLKNTNSIDHVKKTFQASSFQMHCVATKTVERISEETNLDLSYKATNNELKSIEQMPVQILKDQVSFSVVIDKQERKNVFYKLEADTQSLFKEYFQALNFNAIFELTIISLEGFLSTMLVEKNNCMFGGITIYNILTYYQKVYKEIFNLCSNSRLHNIPIYLEFNHIKLLFMSYAGYTDGVVRFTGQIVVKPNHKMMLDMSFVSFIKMAGENVSIESKLDIGDEKTSNTFVLQPYIMGEYISNNYLLTFIQSESYSLPMMTASPTLILTFIFYPQYLTGCARCYVTIADKSDFIKWNEGKKEIKPIIQSNNMKSIGQIEAAVDVVSVDQSACQGEQIWTLLIKAFTNLDKIAYGNVSRSVVLGRHQKTIYRYIEKSNAYIWYLLTIFKPTIELISSIVQVELDLSCLTTDVFIEHFVNNSQSTTTSVLYKWTDTSKTIWMSDFDTCNIILVSEKDKIPNACRDKLQGLDLIFVKHQLPLHKTLFKTTKLPRFRSYNFFHMR